MTEITAAAESSNSCSSSSNNTVMLLLNIYSLLSVMQAPETWMKRAYSGAKSVSHDFCCL